MYYADYHVHTAYSDDSVYPMSRVVSDAVEKGINELCFTDHVDYGVKDDREWGNPVRYADGQEMLNVDYPAYFAEIEKLQQHFKEKIVIKKGLEFGVQTHTVEHYNKLFASYPMDFVILSVHQVDNNGLWTEQFREGRSQQQYNELYYNEIWKVINLYNKFSVLGHLDSIVRYDPMGVYPFPLEVVAETLKKVISMDKGIELNMASRRYKLKDSTPCREILKMYQDFGGKIITIGSDSHSPLDLGEYITEGALLLKSMGFTEFCTYTNMVPEFHKL